ncbi:unnamed protein product [Parajaminaea phylloscopi]
MNTASLRMCTSLGLPRPGFGSRVLPLSAELGRPALTQTRALSRSCVPSSSRPGSIRHARSPFVRLQSPPQFRSQSTTPSSSVQDAEHPNGLWYHLVSQSGEERTYAVSFLPTPPSSSSSPAILALFSTQRGEDPIEFARNNPDRIEAPKPFWQLLHQTLKEDIVRNEKDPILVQEADLRENGWAHLADERQPLMPGRIPTPDAIIATVSFTECKLAPDSYTPNDTYRPITKEEGFTVLRSVWLDALKEALKGKDSL